MEDTAHFIRIFSSFVSVLLNRLAFFSFLYFSLICQVLKVVIFFFLVHFHLTKISVYNYFIYSEIRHKSFVNFLCIPECARYVYGSDFTETQSFGLIVFVKNHFLKFIFRRKCGSLSLNQFCHFLLKSLGLFLTFLEPISSSVKWNYSKYHHRWPF